MVAAADLQVHTLLFQGGSEVEFGHTRQERESLPWWRCVVGKQSDMTWVQHSYVRMVDRSSANMISTALSAVAYRVLGVVVALPMAESDLVVAELVQWLSV